MSIDISKDGMEKSTSAKMLHTSHTVPYVIVNSGIVVTSCSDGGCILPWNSFFFRERIKISQNKKRKRK